MRKRKHPYKKSFMPQESITGATRTEQTVNAPTVPTPSPINVQGLTEDQEARLAGWSGALRTNRVNNVWRRMAAAKTTVDARYILVEEMESMKGSNRFTDMFWTDIIVEDICLHRFTPGTHFQKEQLWKGLSLLLCGMMYVSDQTSFRNEEEDQTKATLTMDYKTLKAIRAGK